MKYTLFCRPGINFSPGLHYLVLGSWLASDENTVILAHGNMTDERARKLIHEERVAIFRDCRYHILSIEGCYSEGYKRRVEESDLNQFTGYLIKQPYNNRIFAGVLEI